MMEISFEWDQTKAKANEAKHGVSFGEAKTVFFDEYALVIPDPDHSKTEERFVFMGMSALSRVLVVVHCFRSNNNVIRIISARRAGAKEKATIPEGMNMRKIYDFSAAQQSPYVKRLKKQVTIRLEEEVILYFKALSAETGIPYQNLINLYLRDCAASNRKLALGWKSEKSA